jgi:uncharacterized protein
MLHTDKSQAFLEQFPAIEPDRSFRFACHPGVPCYNACCSKLKLPLTPYDVLRLRRELELSFQEFLHRFGTVVFAPDTGLPAMRLKMLGDKAGSCPFLTPRGCSVYPNRPGACRTYPVGRAATVENGTLCRRYFLIQEPHCHGFKEGPSWTPEEWMSDQGTGPYNRSNDRYVQLMSGLRARGMSIPPRKSGMALMALYGLDEFRPFLLRLGVMEKLGLGQERSAAILDDEEKILDFGFDWMNKFLFGDSQAFNQERRKE